MNWAREIIIYTYYTVYLFIRRQKLAHVSVNTSIYDDRGFIAP